jgi:hypothetical protein
LIAPGRRQFSDPGDEPKERRVTQAINPDRSATTVSDRERPLPARAEAARQGAGQQQPTPPAAPAPRDTADVAQGSALLRAQAQRDAGNPPTDAAQAAAKAARITELLSGDPARAMRTYAGIRGDDVQALLATA